MQRFGIRVAELELDMLAVAFDGFAANAEFFRDLTAAVSSSDSQKYCHLAITEDIEAGWRFAITGKLPHREGSDCPAGVDLARQYSLNRVH